MSTPSNRRSRKRLVTRQAISDVATRLFHERGFDRVTVDEIAAAADVGRMTVFNHFPRKEDMFFDLDENGRQVVFEALRQRKPDVAPIEALRQLVYLAVEQRQPYVDFSVASQSFMQTIESSEVLKARSRAIRDELAQDLAVELAKAVHRGADDFDAHVAASFLVTTWSVAYAQAQAAFARSQDTQAAQRLLLAIIDMGAVGLKAMMASTPYV